MTSSDDPASLLGEGGRATPAVPNTAEILPIRVPPLPDELLGSYVCRAAVLNGFPSFGAMAEAFIGDWPKTTARFRPLSNSFPSSAAGARLLAALGWIEDDAWEELTVLPYWRTFGQYAHAAHAFTGRSLWREAIDEEGPKRVAQRRDVTRKSCPLPLRWCPACMRQDVVDHEMAYFHRSHQLPLTLICAEHECALAESCASCSRQWDAFGAPEPLTARCCCGQPLDRTTKEEDRSTAWLALARLSRQALLDADLRLDIDRLWQTIMSSLREAGDLAGERQASDTEVGLAIQARLIDIYGVAGFELIGRDGLASQPRTGSSRANDPHDRTAAGVPQLCAALAVFFQDLRPLQGYCGAPPDGIEVRRRSPETVSAPEILEEWLAIQRLRGERYTVRTVGTYRSVWLSWVRWLGELRPPPVTWHAAQREHVLEFLRSIKPLSSKRAATAQEDTAERYQRTLYPIYQYAHDVGLIASLPTATERSTVAISQAQVLDSTTLSYLRANLPDSGGRWQGARDRAFIALLLHLGITVREVSSLSIDNLRGIDAGPMCLHVDVPGGAAARILDVPEPACVELRAWIAARPTLRADDKTLFLSKKANGALTAVTVYTLVNDWLVLHGAALPSPAPRLGPKLLRSSVIAEWITQGLPRDEVLRLSGLAAPNCLTRYISAKQNDS